MQKELSLLFKIYRKKYDLVINLTEGDRGAIAALLSKSSIRVGVDPHGQGMLGKRKCFTHLIKYGPHQRHTVEKQLDALRRIGIFPQAHERDLFLHTPDAAKAKILEALAREELHPKGYIVIHPVARWLFKALAPSQMAQVIHLLHENKEQVVLSSGPDPQELEVVQKILDLVPHVPVVNMAGKLSLKELCALIFYAKTLCCVDSVPLHIASALKTPVVVVFGPTSEVNWGPWMHDKARVAKSDHSCRPCYQEGCGGSKRSDCLLALSPERIVQEILNLSLSDHNLKSSPK